jgi:hypothetical protein
MDDSNRATTPSFDHGWSPKLPRYLRWLVPLSVLVLLLLVLLLALGFKVLIYASQPTVSTAADVAWRTARERETTLRQDLALLQEQWLGRQTQCPVMVARPPSPDTKLTPPSTKAEVELPPSPAPDQHERPDTETVSPFAKNTFPPIPPGTPLSIPTNPENMDFLSGCWRSITSLAERRTKKPIQHEYCFDDRGNGKVIIRSNRYVCTGKINATMQGQKELMMKTIGRVPCAKNNEVGYFFGWEAVCQSQTDGTALCQAVEETKTRFNFRLLRN